MSSLQSSFENEGFNLQPGLQSPNTTIMPQQDFLGMTPIVSSGNSIEMHYESMTSIPPGSMPTVISRSRSTIEQRSLSRNSHSPAMSDSGISLEAGSTGSNSSAPLVNIAALAKLGAVGVYGNQGIGGCGNFADLLPSAQENS